MSQIARGQSVDISVHPVLESLEPRQLLSAHLAADEGETYSISGLTYEDVNQNTVRDEGEPALAGVTVTLDRDNDQVVDFTTISDGDGLFTFADMPGGVYYCISAAPQAGWILTAGEYVFLVAPDSILDRFEIGTHRVTGISGSVFDDANQNGARDEGEVGLAGWYVALDEDPDGDGIGDIHFSGADADEQGNYDFGDLPPGSYVVSRHAPYGWEQTLPAGGSYAITLTEGQQFTTADFGYHALPSSISGTAFEDRDLNYTLDEGEPVLAGWTITLDQGSDGTIDYTTVTDELGNYSFTGLTPNTPYSVAQVVQPGWAQTVGDYGLQMMPGANFTGIDFGSVYLNSVAISGTKFEDLNLNGYRDEGEPGLAGWTILLDQYGDGTIDYMAVTDELGNYSFPDLEPETYYYIAEVEQPGWGATSSWSWFLPSPGENLTGIDLGGAFLNSVSISGTKFEDINGNGARDEGEPGLAGWTIVIATGGVSMAAASSDGGGQNVQYSTVTDENGDYSFTGLEGWRYYTLAEVLPLGWTQTMGSNFIYTEPYQTLTGLDFGNHRTTGVRGALFYDANQDGLRDEGETPLAGWCMYLETDSDGDGVGDVLYAVRYTDEQGIYDLSDVLAGSYVVRHDAPSGWVQTLPAGGSYAFTLAEGELVTTADFGLYAAPAGISGKAFNDLDANGIQDEGEEGQGGWTIALDRNGDGSIDYTTVTDELGNYEFTDLPPSAYYSVYEIEQSGWLRTNIDGWFYLNPGDQYDGVANPFSGLMFGNHRMTSIGGTAYEDANRNGLRDEGEAGLAECEVSLDVDQDGDGIVDYTWWSQYTDEQGNYFFGDILPGNYVVRLFGQDGWLPSVPVDGSYVIVLAEGEQLVADFGNRNGLTPVFIPDPNLEAAIRTALEKPTGDITEYDLAGVYYLEAYNAGIANLTGLEYCINLQGLWLGGNDIVDISPLSGLTTLVYIGLEDNRISDLKPLTGLTGLNSLAIWDNQIADLTPLTGMSELAHLYAAGNQIVDLSPLAGLSNLYGLGLDGNLISDISWLEEVTSLEWLYLGDNPLQDISPLASLENLRGLFLWDIPLAISTAADLPTGLTDLNLSRCGISDITVLSDLVNLVNLDLSGNFIADISPLANMPNLYELNLDGNQVTDLGPLSDLAGLGNLSAWDNQIVSLAPLVANAGLGQGDFLGIGGNPLSQTSLEVDIPALLARGVNVYLDFDPRLDIYWIDFDRDMLCYDGLPGTPFPELGTWQSGFWLEGYGIHSATLSTPTGLTLDFQLDEDEDWACTEWFDTRAEMLAAFPDGQYIITINNGQDTVVLTIADFAEPTGIATILSPTAGQTGVPGESTQFEWTSCDGLGDGLDLAVLSADDLDNDLYEWEEAPIGQTSWALPGPLAEGREYVFLVEVVRFQEQTGWSDNDDEFGYEFWSSYTNSVLFTTETAVPGDFDGDGVVAAADLDLLYGNLGGGGAFDLNGDGVVDQDDVTFMVQDILHTGYADFNLDRMVDFTDFQTMLDHWQLSAGWGDGDSTGDGVCDFEDFQMLLDYWRPTGYSAPKGVAATGTVASGESATGLLTTEGLPAPQSVSPSGEAFAPPLLAPAASVDLLVAQSARTPIVSNPEAAGDWPDLSGDGQVDLFTELCSPVLMAI